MPLHPLKWIRGWRLDKALHSVKDNIAPVAVSITQTIKTFTEGQLAPSFAAVIDASLGTHLASDALALVKNNIYRVLAAELAIEGLPDNPTDADILAFEQAIFKAITNPEAKSKFWTVFSADTYGIIKSYLDTGADNLTFAQIVELVEKEYQAYKNAKEEDGVVAKIDDPKPPHGK